LQEPGERDRAWKRYHAMRRFVESAHCRHRQICLHFGETPAWERCDACDVCGVEREWLSEQMTPEAAVRRTRMLKPVGAARRESTLDPAVAEALRAWRRKLAKELAVPAYVILHDSTLDEIAARAPRSIAALCEISGIGEKRAERFGSGILGVIAEISSSG
jgi:superfamily II DNA helicase RecQ